MSCGYTVGVLESLLILLVYILPVAVVLVTLGLSTRAFTRRR